MKARPTLLFAKRRLNYKCEKCGNLCDGTLTNTKELMCSDCFEVYLENFPVVFPRTHCDAQNDDAA